MKVTLAQIKSDPGCFETTAAAILDAIQKGKEAGADLIVFPECVIQGYTHLDLVFNPAFVARARQTLEQIAEQTRGITAIVGFVDQTSDERGPGNKPMLLNSAAVLSDGAITAIRDKTLLPEYDIFSEHRYFTPGTRTGLVEIAGRKVGIGICEDMWASGYRTHVYPRLIAAGAQVLVNLSASPFHVGKQAERIEIIEDIVRDTNVSFIYCNLVGSYDGYDGEVVFDGASMAWNTSGKLCALLPAFSEAVQTVDIDAAPEIACECAAPDAQLFAALVFGIQEYFRRSGFERAYVGLSGGIDSAVVASLCVAALGKGRVIGVTMPSHITSQATFSDAQKLAENLGIRCEVRSIAPEYNAWLTEAERCHGQQLQSLTKQNKQARIRGAILMEYSNQDARGIVVSTGNKTELALGYCTLYGDMCGGFAAISDVSKERVYALARYINAAILKDCIPAETITRLPTAELEEGQTDAANLPADYDVMSPLVDALVDQQGTEEELAAQYGREVVARTSRLVQLNEFKRRQAAPGIRVTRKAFGIGRRIPMVHGFNPLGS